MISEVSEESYDYPTLEKQKAHALRKPLLKLARPERFELPTPWFVARYSIQLSYGRVAGAHSIRGCCRW